MMMRMMTTTAMMMRMMRMMRMKLNTKNDEMIHVERQDLMARDA